jgi:hypothetical protein
MTSLVKGSSNSSHVPADTIRRFAPCMPARFNESEYLCHETDPLRGREYVENHRNWPAENAVTYLEGVMENFTSALWMPSKE